MINIALSSSGKSRNCFARKAAALGMAFSVDGNASPASLKSMEADIAMAGIPSRTAVVAAPTVPEIMTSAPTFWPKLIPEITKSGG